METKQLSYYLIDLMKSYINKEDFLSEKSSEIILQIGTAIDRLLSIMESDRGIAKKEMPA